MIFFNGKFLKKFLQPKLNFQRKLVKFFKFYWKCLHDLVRISQKWFIENVHQKKMNRGRKFENVFEFYQQFSRNWIFERIFENPISGAVVNMFCTSVDPTLTRITCLASASGKLLLSSALAKDTFPSLLHRWNRNFSPTPVCQLTWINLLLHLEYKEGWPFTSF